ncbi:MAG: hypothetical protein ACK5KV_00420 [Bacteroides graminisolvens]|jgi:hypothetical protein|uniref:hypothetical protein n=1 Tax=Bacteroides graminisolvens TaxID=477666 RepID=UPI003A8721FA
MEENKRFIQADTKLKQEIADKFEVTIRTVSSALNYETNSPSARLLRAYALNNGGKLCEIRILENPYDNILTL